MFKKYSIILDKILKDLIERENDNIISIYGIGGFFDNLLPSDWHTNDIDLIIIVEDLEKIRGYIYNDLKNFELYHPHITPF